MPEKFIDSRTAAELLDVDGDELDRLRQSNELRGYRDGANWKFKRQDVEALARNRPHRLDLPIDDDDELVLGGSGIGSEVTLGGVDSGIALESPFGFDDPDLERLESSDDDDEEIERDDEFSLLSANHPFEDDEDDESGSQVISLDDSYNDDSFMLHSGSGYGMEPSNIDDPTFVQPPSPRQGRSCASLQFALIAMVLFWIVTIVASYMIYRRQEDAIAQERHDAADRIGALEEENLERAIELERARESMQEQDDAIALLKTERKALLEMLGSDDVAGAQRQFQQDMTPSFVKTAAAGDSKFPTYPSVVAHQKGRLAELTNQLAVAVEAAKTLEMERNDAVLAKEAAELRVVQLEMEASRQRAELAAQFDKQAREHEKQLHLAREEHERKLKAYQAQLRSSPVSPGSNERRIRAALQKPVELEFIEQPLRDVLNEIKDVYDLPLAADRPALAAIGVDLEAPVSIRLKGVRLESALELILSRYELDWVIRHESLLITSSDAAYDYLHTEVYDAADLLVRPGEPFRDDEDLSYAYDALLNLITATVFPESWEDGGGPGTIEAIEGTLVICQHRRAHTQIGQLLTDLRKAREQQVAVSRAAEAAPVGEGVFKVVSYRLMEPTNQDGATGLAAWDFPLSFVRMREFAPPVAAPSDPAQLQRTIVELARKQLREDQSSRRAERLAEIIPTLIEPDSWSTGEGQGEVHAVEGALIVKQTARVHARVRRLLAPFLPPNEPFSATVHDAANGRDIGPPYDLGPYSGGFFNIDNK